MEEKNNIVIYQSEDGKTKIDVKLEEETVWLSQQQMAELFNTSRSNIIEHINNIYAEEELDKEMPKDIAKSRENNSVMPPALKQFGEDITLQAEEGKFDNIIGREKEIERIIQILYL